MRLKASIRKKCKELGVNSQILHLNFMFEHFLDRLTKSVYSRMFIIKGGFLISAIVGLSTRSTMDIDATLKGMTLDKETMYRAFIDICSIKTGDGIEFKVLSIEEIQEGGEYPGLRIHLSGRLQTIITPFSVDLTTGDEITPSALEFVYKPVFGDEPIKLQAYNLETVIAEKVETILRRGTTNTRMRDFFDVYLLFKTRGREIDLEILKRAIKHTSEKRGSLAKSNDWAQIISRVETDAEMNLFWARYRATILIAGEIGFHDACEAVRTIMSLVTKA